MPKTSKATFSQARKNLKSYADPTKAKFLLRFFKTGSGQYAEGDIFIGVVVPDTRKVAKQFSDLPRVDVLKLLKSKIHEERLLALFVLIHQYDRGDVRARQRIYRDYLSHLKHVNNWDLVDASAHHIVGRHLEKGSRTILRKLARSKTLWDRRVAVVATYHFIKGGDYADILYLSEKLLGDKEDLMHKAVGWMLREMGKRDVLPLKDFLRKHHARMPRTMLRYSIEKFPERERKAILKGIIPAD